MEVYLQAADKAIDIVFGPDPRAPGAAVAAKMPMGLDRFASRSIGQLFVKTDDDSLVTFQPHWCPSAFLSGQAKVDGTYRASKIKAKDVPDRQARYYVGIRRRRHRKAVSPVIWSGIYDIARPGDD